MSFSVKLSDQDVRSIDQAGMAVHIAGMGEHLREAIKFTRAGVETIAEANVPQAANIRSIIVAGIGGSAIGGDMVKSYLTGKLAVPYVVSRGYDLPAFADEHSLIIISSYSGNTEESLSMFEQAVAQGLSIICITTGGTIGARAAKLGLPVIAQRPGMQPRAALAYSFAPILLLLEHLGFVSQATSELEALSVTLDGLSERYGVHNMQAGNTAFDLASHLMHRIPVIYSPSDVLEAVNLRWRGQLQENAKHLAFGNFIPEMNHNEISGWKHPLDVLQHLSVLMLRSKEDEHPRVARRCEVVRELLEGKGITVSEVFAEGDSRLKRMFSLVSLADWTSYYLALFTGTDPTPIPSIDLLKQRMS